MKAGTLDLLKYLILTTLLAATASAAHGDELVIPGSLENVDGNGGNIFPFGLGLSYRYQQVYAASEFDPSAPVLITEIRFRPDFLTGDSFSVVLPDVQVNLSTTNRALDALSPTFADNVGADDTIVSDGALALSSSATGAGPFEFDIVIPLATPFLYDPLAGNLLLDVRNFGGGPHTTAFDSHNAAGDPISRATTTHISGDVDSPIATSNDTLGLVTKFVFGAAAIEVVIDVRPGSSGNPVNLGAGGRIPVAILTTDDFDAATTDPDQPILLGDPDLAGAAAPLRGTLEDVDGDGDLDLLLHFSMAELVAAGAIDHDSQFLGLTATTLDGTAIGGLDIVTIMPQ